MSQANTQGMLDHHTSTPLHKLQVKGLVKWLQGRRPWPSKLYFTLPPQPPAPAQMSIGTTISSTIDAIPTPPPSIVLLTCPTCQLAVDGTRQAFADNNLDGRTYCKRCKRYRFVRLWTCSCQLPWYECPIHSGEPARLRRQSPGAQAIATEHTTTARQRGLKRTLGQGRDQHVAQWLDRHKPSVPRAPSLELGEIELTPTKSISTHTASNQPSHYYLGPKLTAKLQQWRAAQTSSSVGPSNDHLHIAATGAGQDTRSHPIPSTSSPAADISAAASSVNASPPPPFQNSEHHN